jgi:MFS family permease
MRWALAGLSLSMLMPSLDTSIANVALPTLADAFGASFRAVQWVVLAYLIAITALIVGAGRLGDLLGRRRLLLAGIALFTAASLLCGAAPTLPVLVAARAVQGLGAAIMMALTVAVVGETVPKGRIGSAMGLLGTMSAIGTTLGPSIGGLLIAGAGWRMMFLVNVPLGIANFLLARRTLPADRPRAAAAWPWTGMFRDRTLGAGLAATVLVSAVMMATMVVGPFYLARALGLDAVRVGVVMSVGPLMAAIAGIFAGRVVDRFGAHRMAITGLGLMSVGLLALALSPGTFGIAGYVASIVVVTAHYALFQAANNTSVMTGAAVDGRGVVSGMLGLSRYVGLIAGASAMGAVFAHAVGATDVTTAAPAAVAAGMRTTFLVAATLVLAAMVVLLSSERSVGRSAPRRGGELLHDLFGHASQLLHVLRRIVRESRLPLAAPQQFLCSRVDDVDHHTPLGHLRHRLLVHRPRPARSDGKPVVPDGDVERLVRARVERDGEVWFPLDEHVPAGAEGLRDALAQGAVGDRVVDHRIVGAGCRTTVAAHGRVEHAEGALRAEVRLGGDHGVHDEPGSTAGHHERERECAGGAVRSVHLPSCRVDAPTSTRRECDGVGEALNRDAGSPRRFP